MPKFSKAHRAKLSKAAKARHAAKKKSLFVEYGAKIGETLQIRLPKDYVVTDGPKMPFTPAPLCLCGQLEDAILLLETRISNAVAKINSLMG